MPVQQEVLNHPLKFHFWLDFLEFANDKREVFRSLSLEVFSPKLHLCFHA